MRFTSTLFFLFISVFALAQIPNSGFENGTESSITDWRTSNGKAGVYSTYTFKANSGDSILKPESGSKFAVLEKNGAGQGAITAKFAFNQRAAELTGKFMYLANSSVQRFSVEITYLDWTAAILSSDTMMHLVEKVNPYNEQKVKNYDWFFLSIPIDKFDFRLNGNPDSCIITITLDNGLATDPNTKLFIDDLKFGSELVAGISELSEIGVSVFPNPSSGTVFLQGLEKDDVVKIYNLQGQLVLDFKAGFSNEFSFDLPKGTFVIQHLRNETSTYQRFLVL